MPNMLLVTNARGLASKRDGSIFPYLSTIAPDGEEVPIAWAQNQANALVANGYGEIVQPEPGVRVAFAGPLGSYEFAMTPA